VAVRPDQVRAIRELHNLDLSILRLASMKA